MGYLDEITRETLKVFPDSFLRELLQNNTMSDEERIVEVKKVDNIITQVVGQKYRNKRSRLRHLISNSVFTRLWVLNELEGDISWMVGVVYESHSRNWKGTNWKPPFSNSRLLLAMPCGTTIDENSFQWNIIYLEYIGI